MRMPDGNMTLGKRTFRKMKRPERLVLISSFPGEKDWPAPNKGTG
jgi:hypothetical protein